MKKEENREDAIIAAVQESYRLAMQCAGIDAALINEIEVTVSDAIANNLF